MQTAHSKLFINAIQLSRFVCAYHPAAPSSSPNHTISAKIIYSQVCAIFVTEKKENQQK